MNASNLQRKKPSRWWLGCLLMAIAVPLVIISGLFVLIDSLCIYSLIQIFWLPRGKRALIVTSNSPHWKQYMQDEFISTIGAHGIVLNWSERNTWGRFNWTAAVFRHFGSKTGGKFIPLVVVFLPLHRAKVFRLWKPFKDSVNAKTKPLEIARQEILALVQRAT